MFLSGSKAGFGADPCVRQHPHICAFETSKSEAFSVFNSGHENGLREKRYETGVKNKLLVGVLFVVTDQYPALELEFVPVGRYVKAQGGGVEKILISGKHAFVSQLPEINVFDGTVGQGGGLHAVSIVDPVHPRLVAHYPSGVILDFTIDGSTLLLLEEPRSLQDGTRLGGGLHVIELSQPSHPERVGFLPWPASGNWSRPIAGDGELVYLTEQSANGHRLAVIDISDPANPAPVSTYSPSPGWRSWPTFLLPAGDYLYVVAGGEVHTLNVSNPSALRTIATYPAGDTIMAAALDGNRLYLAQRRSESPISSSFCIVDVTSPANPSRIGHLPGGIKQPVALAVQQNHAFLLELDDPRESFNEWRKGTLRIIDVGIPSEARQVGLYETTGIYRTDQDTRFPMGAIPVASEGNLAVLGDSGRIAILNVSNRADPEFVSRHVVRSDARDVTMMGHHACVADALAGLEIIDLSDPSAPWLAGQYPMSAPANSVTVDGSIGYVAARDGLHVVDLSEPGNPRKTGFWPTAGDSQKVFVSGNFSFVAALPGVEGSGGLHILDTTDFSNPRWVATYGTTARDVTVSGNYAYVVVLSENTVPPFKGQTNFLEELHVVDITNPHSPERKLIIPTSAQSLVHSIDRIYVAGSAQIMPFGLGGGIPNMTGLTVFDVRDPIQPLTRGNYIHVGDRHARDIAVSDRIVYLTDHTWFCGHGCYFQAATVRALDISDPTNPQSVGAYRLPDYPEELPVRSDLGVATSGSLILVAAGGSGLHVLKTAPSNPQSAGNYDATVPVSNVTVYDHHLYLTESFWDPLSDRQRWRLEIIDPSSPSAPRSIGTYETTNAIVTAALSTNRAVLLEAGQEQVAYLKIFETIDPASMVAKGNYSIPGQAVDLVVSGPFAYLLVRDVREGTNFVHGMLEAFDLSDAETPRRIGRYRFDQNPITMTVAGNRAYIVEVDPMGSTERRLEIVDLIDASNPRRIGQFYTSNVLVDVVVAGRYAYLAAQPDFGGSEFAGGLCILDVHNPSEPKVVGRIFEGLYSRGVAVLGDYIYLLEGDPNGGAVHVVDARNPENPRRVGGNTLDSGTFTAIAAADGKIFVAAGEEGLIMLHAYRPITFESVALRPNTAFEMRIAGPPGVPAVIQGSGDLRAWEEVMPLSFDEKTQDISLPSGQLPRFYRVTTQTR